MPKKSKSTPPDIDDAAVRDRAYLLWEADGRPEGRAEHYWHMAQAAAAPVKQKRASKPKAPPPVPEKKPRKSAKAS